MPNTQRVRVLDTPRICAGCNKTIEGTAVKHKTKGRKAVYFHAEATCLKGK